MYSQCKHQHNQPTNYSLIPRKPQLIIYASPPFHLFILCISLNIVMGWKHQMIQLIEKKWERTTEIKVENENVESKETVFVKFVLCFISKLISQMPFISLFCTLTVTCSKKLCGWLRHVTTYKHCHWSTVFI